MIARGRPRYVLAAGAIAAVFALAAYSWGPGPTGLPTALVIRQTFTDALVESGTISSARLRLYGSRLEGPAKLLEIVMEGSAVREGDLLARFDTTLVEQALAREQAALEQADATAARAREEVRVESLRAAADLDTADHQTRNAEEALGNQAKGRGAVEVIAAETAAADAGRALDEARSTYDDMKPLLEEAFVTRAEFDRAEQSLRRAEDQHRLALARLESLMQFERPAALARAQAEVTLARTNAARQSESLVARVRERQATLALVLSRADEIRARLAILRDQVSRGEIRADASGLAVYRPIYFGTDHRKPAVGDEIMPGQDILAVPDVSAMTVETHVREMDLHRLAMSNAVRVRVDAYPDILLPAAVTLVGALAQEDASRAGTKFFPVTVTLRASDGRLRNGMTARVEIEVASLPDALVVPAQAVFHDGTRTFVIVLEKGTTVRRPVTVAARNGTHAAVAGAIAAGDRVSLVDPAALPADR